MQKKKTIAMKKVARRKYDLGSKGGGITLLLLLLQLLELLLLCW